MTIGQQLDDDVTEKIFDTAYKLGINFFDTAEGYAGGECENSFGKVIKKLGWKRKDFVLSTKLFWGGSGVNDRGLSRKHIIEGMDASLARLQTDYVDIVFAHRPDPKTPMEEVVRAFTQIINSGKAHYWGTSMWSAFEIEHAHHIATKHGLIAPVVEQPVYNLLERQQFEKELRPVFDTYGYGSTVYSPLATGLLTGKYTKDVIPAGSRYHKDNWKVDQVIPSIFKDKFQGENAEADFNRIQQLQEIANELKVEMAPLALAVLLKNKHVSTLITGASKPEQVIANVKAYEVLPLLSDEVLARIEKIFPPIPPREDFGRLGY